MQLLPQLAKKIVDEVQVIMKEHVIVVDQKAIIIASTDKNRIGTFHEGARLVMKTKKKLHITEESAKVLKGVKAGINLPIFFDGNVIGVIGITGIPSEIEGYADLLRKMTELMIREAYHFEQKEWEMRGLEAFFYEWVITKEVDEAFIHQGQMLGIPIGISYLCVLMQIESKLEQQSIKSEKTNWMNKQFASTPDDFFIRWGEGRFLLLKKYDEQTSKSYLKTEYKRWKGYFEKKYESKCSIGISSSVVKYDINVAYAEAEKALKVAKNKGGIVFYEDLFLDIILEEVSDQTRREFTERVLTGMEDDKQLIETLRTYLLKNQSIKVTAASLHIHSNTLHYRLKQIKELTGIDPRTTEGITLFFVALCYLSETGGSSALLN
ncbi:hypothetical protein GH741_01045 [Aquibacillus halophilus]|uniref:Carbohydrate diacid regulator n=1 Tax=Aquibacillus halophilus TaxID=930132 RepID=A0A6A8D9N9_9BACI|nr:sugar diacid recognition domain-containing protein [Aquibacillus halophilus]MRH41256.1 hypothetical protein [Aquibacillus halophilus]